MSSRRVFFFWMADRSGNFKEKESCLKGMSYTPYLKIRFPESNVNESEVPDFKLILSVSRRIQHLTYSTVIVRKHASNSRNGEPMG